CVHVNAANTVRIYYSSSSRRLADDVARLLTRFGITAQIKTVRKDGYRDNYHVHLIGSELQREFLVRIGCHGARGKIAERAKYALVGISPNTNVDTIPRGVWERVRVVLQEQQMTHHEFATAMSTQFCDPTPWKL